MHANDLDYKSSFASTNPLILNIHTNIHCSYLIYDARGVMVIVAGYGHSDTSSNPGPD